MCRQVCSWHKVEAGMNLQSQMNWKYNVRTQRNGKDIHFICTAFHLESGAVRFLGTKGKLEYVSKEDVRTWIINLCNYRDEMRLLNFSSCFFFLVYSENSIYILQLLIITV